LNKTSGALYAKAKFDYETVQLYEILIRATENCTCELSMPNTSQTVFCEDLDELPYDAINDLSRIKIKLQIIDVNDNEPYFTKTSYKLGLTPDISYGESILEGFVSIYYESKYQLIESHNKPLNLLFPQNNGFICYRKKKLQNLKYSSVFI
jgi:hypothetical protein